MRTLNFFLLLALFRNAISATDVLIGEFLEDIDDAQYNDGSPPLYYRRIHSNSSEWMIYLEGGGFATIMRPAYFATITPLI